MRIRRSLSESFPSIARSRVAYAFGISVGDDPKWRFWPSPCLPVPSAVGPLWYLMYKSIYHTIVQYALYCIMLLYPVRVGPYCSAVSRRG